MTLEIRTPAGDCYRVVGGQISRLEALGFNPPSGQWIMRGLVPVNMSRVTVPLEAITQAWLDAHPLLYKNGNPRYTVADIDHGTRRIWGNTKYHGVKSISIRREGQ